MSAAEELTHVIRSGWRLVALESFEEDRALKLLERVAAGSDRTCLPWTLGSGLGAQGNSISELDCPGAGSFAAGLEAMADHEAPALFVVLDAHRVLDDPVAVRRMRDLLPVFGARLQILVLVAPVLELPLELVREAARVDFPLPSAAELSKLFHRVVEKQQGDKASTDETVLDDAVRGALGLTASEAVRVFRKACRVAGGLGPSCVGEVVREKRRVLGRTPALSFYDGEDESLEAVGGLEELKLWLRERRRAFGEEARRFGLPSPRGLLLLGVQGCGKSLSAKAVAREWQFPLLRLDLASAFGSVSQSPEMAMREAIAVAESLAPAVLWIDEIEKGFSASGSDAAASRVFGSFLTWLAEKRAPVFVVATANDVTGLPPELLRRGRFDEIFFVDLPSAEERAEILSIHLAKRGRDPRHFRLDELAEQAARLTGAELEQIVASALYGAFSEGRELDEDDLSDAITEAVPLYDTYEERIKELRDWARHRARPASSDERMVDLFGP